MKQDPGFPTVYTAQDTGIYLTLTPEGSGRKIKVLKPQDQWTGKLWNTVQAMLDGRARGCGTSKFIQIKGPYGNLPATALAHPALMLVGAGIGFPSTLSMLRRCLNDNITKSADEQQAVCFMWSASKVDQLLLCFPSLLADLAHYVHRYGKQSGAGSSRGLADLRSWLTIKIFVGEFEAGDFLNVQPGATLFPSDEDMQDALFAVREWLLGPGLRAKRDALRSSQMEPCISAALCGQPQQQPQKEHAPNEGTYIAQGSLGGCFGDILRCSSFTREKVMRRPNSLGVCFCGPLDLSSWVEMEVGKTILPRKVEFVSEATG